MNKPSFLLCLFAATSWMISFAAVAEEAKGTQDTKPVTVELKDAKGEKVGEATLSSVSGGVKIHVRASKLSPGKHGIHIHEKGVCQGPDFKSAGGHFNPARKEHGLENAKGPHAGDMPNIDASRSGTVNTDIVAHGVTLGTGPDSLERPEGAALVIHAKADDQHSNPAGDSGDRVVCGEIAALPAHGSR